MMKKYWGKKEWSESLYLSNVYPEDAIDSDWNIDESKAETRFCLGFPFDWEKIHGFDDGNWFEDTNDFIKYSEYFNIFQYRKI